MEDLLALIKRDGGPTAAARTLGVTPQRLYIWQQRGPSPEGRLRAWLAIHKPSTWMLYRARELDTAGVATECVAATHGAAG